MKKIILLVMASVLAFSFTACTSGGVQLENVYTSEAPKADTIKQSDYEDSLDGLQKYFKALGYIPEKASATEMLSNVIGAKKGVRYTFTVNSSTIVMELYEYDTQNLNTEATRVLNEIKKDGKFVLFETSSDNENQSFEAILSDTEKYMMIYTDSSSDEANTTRKKDVENTLKSFKK